METEGRVKVFTPCLASAALLLWVRLPAPSFLWAVSFTREAGFDVVCHHASIITLPDSCVASRRVAPFHPASQGGGPGACSSPSLPTRLKSEVFTYSFRIVICILKYFIKYVFSIFGTNHLIKIRLNQYFPCSCDLGRETRFEFFFF